jgi:hypothetical protein
LRTNETAKARYIVNAFAYDTEEAEKEWAELYERTALERTDADDNADAKRGWEYRLGLLEVKECFAKKERRRSKTIMNLVRMPLIFAPHIIDPVIGAQLDDRHWRCVADNYARHL